MFCLHVYFQEAHVCPVSSEARKGHQMPWIWSLPGEQLVLLAEEPTLRLHLKHFFLKTIL